MSLKSFCFFLITLFMVITSPASARGNNNDTITITTYYPAPYGIYGELQVQGKLAVGDFRSDPAVQTMSALHDQQLYVSHSTLLRPLSADPPAAESIEGQVIYNNPDNMLKFFNGTHWVNAGCVKMYRWDAVAVGTEVAVDEIWSCQYQGATARLPEVLTNNTTPPCFSIDNTCPHPSAAHPVPPACYSSYTEVMVCN